ncbi:hypothetical protein KIN20_034845 [Parelaphostrongylus tenuis]|uniref:Uncharacterized protein n=1 Tax=Parelaphostrongylus tenuis TaxID=148309 RepID=A0AAD5RAA8_PARTN|nr:hypothetical protein KIN20_034845 [Parelaphostrongylus tenuis]
MYRKNAHVVLPASSSASPQYGVAEIAEDLRGHVENLILDGALPSPIISLCCADRKCFECYVACETVVERKIGRVLSGDDFLALTAYMGSTPAPYEYDDKTQSYQKCLEENKYFSRDEYMNTSTDSMMKRLYQSWRLLVPPQAVSDRPITKKKISFMRTVKKLSVRNCAANTHEKCVGYRDHYSSLYQEFSLFVYPQESSELGVPMFRLPLSNGTALTRIFHLYLYNKNESTLSDIALLEMVDPSLTSICDHKKLSTSGFCHEIDANGTTYWARGTLFYDIGLQSKCTIKAAVSVRVLAVNPEIKNHEIIRCTQTIAKWLEIMGLEKNGFRVIC